jgi:hypothetical protein
MARFCTNIGEPVGKGQKAVGWWLAGCSGMVFVAVALGGTVLYGLLILCIMVVLDKVMDRTVR